MAFSRKYGGGALVAIALSIAAPARAQTIENMGAREILELLVAQGLVPKEKAQEVIDKLRVAAEAQQQQAQQQASAAPATGDVIDVPFVPEALRQDLKAELKAEMATEARKEGWLAPDVLPDWVRGITLSTDFRLRYQAERFDESNFPLYPDLTAINAAGGVVTANGFPLRNFTDNRQRFLFRGRLNVEARIVPEVKLGLRIAGGEVTGPISTSSNLGDFFQRDDIWIDQAWARIALFEGAHATVGRIPNPFYATDMIWDPDINPEALAVRLDQPLGEKLRAFGVVAAMPLDERESASDSFLYAGQVGLEADAGNGLSAKIGLSYYQYQNLQSVKNVPGGSRLNDYSAPRYFQRGNSTFNIRTDGLTTLAGLAADFRIGAAIGSVAFKRGDVTYRLTGEAVNNFGLDAAEVAALQVVPGAKPGALGYQMRLDIGHEVLAQANDWRLAAAYKRIESDAVYDLFTDSDFALGATDSKGYLIEAEYGIYKNTSVGAAYLSSDTISGAPISVDVLQVNLNVRF